MATALTRIKNISYSINLLCKQFSTVKINTKQSTIQKSYNNNLVLSFIAVKNISTSAKRCDLMEFFDDKKNWGESEVKCGRSWRLDELRIKSNEDLHKLWYILLKERNMLLTMEEECKEKYMLFPSPERIDKVKESMDNLETVVRERNKAYHMLETGETGERPVEYVSNAFGLRMRYRQSEHLIPKDLNTAWRKKHNFNPRGHAVNKFLLHYFEKKYLEKKKKRTRDRNHVMGLLKRFPDLDMEAVKEQYPDVDVNKCLNDKKARGNFWRN